MEIVDTDIENHKNLSLEVSYLRAITPLEHFESIYDDIFDSLYSPQNVEEMIDGLRMLQEIWTLGFLPLLFKVQQLNTLLHNKYKEKNCHISVVLKGFLIIQKTQIAYTTIQTSWHAEKDFI